MHSNCDDDDDDAADVAVAVGVSLKFLESDDFLVVAPVALCWLDVAVVVDDAVPLSLSTIIITFSYSSMLFSSSELGVWAWFSFMLAPSFELDDGSAVT